MAEHTEISDNATLVAELKSLMRRDIKACPLSRVQIAEQLGERVGRTVTVSQIDAYVAPTKPHHFPAAWIPAWCCVTGSRATLALLCRQSGAWLTDDSQRRFADLGRAYLTRRGADKTIGDLERELEGQL